MNSTGRNDPCPCGSNRKYKHCCLHGGGAALPGGATAGGSLSVPQLLQSALELQRAGRLREAEALYRKVLKISPDHADALHLLGLMARQEGDHQLAVELIGKAARLNPAAPLYFNLGNAYQSLGRLGEAVGSFRQALALNPGYVAAFNNLGIAYQIQGNLKESIECFHKALALQPNYAELYSNLGDALRENGQFEAAVESLEHAIALKPDFPNAHLNLGRAFHDMAMPEKARASLHKSLELNPESAEAHLALAMVYSAGGQFDAVKAHIDKALQIDPNNPEAWASIAFSKKMTLEDDTWAEKAQEFLKSGLTPKVETHLSYALGKYYDDVRRYDLAFSCYSRANRCQKGMSAAFKRDQHRNLVDSLIAANTSESARRQTEGASTSEMPVFIVGMPRSGTSLMEQILASHPDVCGAGELDFWNQEAKGYFPDMAAWYGNPAKLEDATRRYEAELLRHSPAALRVVDKMPSNFMNLGMIHAAFPGARIIHMQRNPVDTCLSIYFQGFSAHHTYANDLEDLAFYYREYRRLMEHWRKVLSPETLLEVPYEGLVEDQEDWSRRVIGFIGLEWDDRCLRFHETERRVGTASNWQVRQKIYKTSKARWMNYREHIGPLLTLLESEAD